MAQDVDVQLVGDVEDELDETVVRVENFQTLVAVRRRGIERHFVGVTHVGHVGTSAKYCRRIKGKCDASGGRSCQRFSIHLKERLTRFTDNNKIVLNSV